MRGANARGGIPALGAVESVLEGPRATPDGIGALDDVEEGSVRVFVHERVQKTHRRHLGLQPRLVQQADQSREGGRRCGRAAHGPVPPARVDVVALAEGGNVWGGAAERREGAGGGGS